MLLLRTTIFTAPFLLLFLSVVAKLQNLAYLMMQKFHHLLSSNNTFKFRRYEKINYKLLIEGSDGAPVSVKKLLQTVPLNTSGRRVAVSEPL